MRNCFDLDDKPVEVISVQHDSGEQWPQMMLDTKALTQILLGNVDAKGLPVGYWLVIAGDVDFFVFFFEKWR